MRKDWEAQSLEYCLVSFDPLSVFEFMMELFIFPAWDRRIKAKQMCSTVVYERRILSTVSGHLSLVPVIGNLILILETIENGTENARSKSAG